MTTQEMNKNTPGESMKSKTRRNTKQLALWTGLWLVSLALVAFGPKFLWDFHTVVTVCTVITNLVMGYKMIMANKQHLQDLDELQQRIQLEAMALSLGISMVFGAIFGLIEGIRLVTFSPNPSAILFVMGITYFVGVLFSTRKYA
ncbi:MULTISPECIES: hypothetical protein [Alteromonadaceae]|jgi:hypothetical protein|uniref:Uncharacterized protein n=1 Tax=Brumicola blandensis TaxID=3075611 RepID=A0AAW8R394_9ALTE|nr:MULTISPECIES: hypothetical protein [unclassified Alteromonas]MDT0583737.1 hypothetical protein [Alteromonas sp. W409]MDT0629138.1 hypothetical protein [Alteromonas sp. W364]